MQARAHGDQVITMIEALLGIGGVHHPADAHHRHLGEGVRSASRSISSISGVGSLVSTMETDAGSRPPRSADNRLPRAASFSSRYMVSSKRIPRDLHLLRREAIADDKGIVSILAGHFVGSHPAPPVGNGRGCRGYRPTRHRAGWSSANRTAE